MEKDQLERIPLVVGVTGHRDLVADELPQISACVTNFFEDLNARYPDLPILILSGLAEGADTLVSKAAEQAGCRVINVLPMPKELYQSDFDDQSMITLERMIADHETIELPLLPGLSQESVLSYGGERNLQYERLGAFLAAHAHILLALWDGKYNGAVGGTGQVVDFHQRDVSALADDQIRSQLDMADDESDLVYHVVCSRQSSGEPEEGLQIGQASWFTRDDVKPRVDQLPQRYADVFDQMQVFNRDMADLPSDIATYGLDPEHVDSPAHQAIQRIFGLSDYLATRYQTRVLWALRTTLLATVCAGLSFIVYADFDDQGDLIWGYFLFVSVALGSYMVARRQDWQRRYLDYRVLAEGLRVQYYWALAGVAMENPSRYSHDSFFQGRDLQLGWIRNVMRVTGLQGDVDHRPSDEEITGAIEGWVGDADSGQLGYYRRKAGDKFKKHKHTGYLTAAAFVLGLLAAAVLAVGADQLSSSASNWLVAVMGLLPIVAASRQNYAHRVAERELAAQYAHMLSVFESAHRLLQQTEDTSSKQLILRDLGEAALNENAQWVLRQRERPLPGSDAGT